MCVCVCVCLHISARGCDMRVKVLSHNLHSCPMPFLLYKFRVGGGVVELKTTAVLIATLLFSWDLCSARTDV